MPEEDFARVHPRLELIPLETRQLLFDVNQVIEHVFFPENCVASIIGLMPDGSAVETATVGDEGMVGLPVFHGTDRTTSQAFCQVSGQAFRLPSDVFRKEVRRSDALTLMLHRYSQALFTLVAQSSACNRLHNMRQRCARWLLHTHDRVGADRGVTEFSLTQQFLSQMLGVRRATVTEAMGLLQDAGAVEYDMGRITVIDRARLEALACDCYPIVRSEFDRLLADTRRGGKSTPNPLDHMRTAAEGKTLVGDAVPDAETDA